MQSKHRIRTEFNKDIIKHTTFEDNILYDTSVKLLEEIMDLKEEATRQALIANGWTPPEDKPNYESWVTGIINELESEGFDCDMDTFKNWLIFSAKAEDAGGSYVEVLSER